MLVESSQIAPQITCRITRRVACLICYTPRRLLRRPARQNPHRIACRNACRMGHLMPDRSRSSMAIPTVRAPQCSTTAFTTVCAPQCSSNDLSDRSSLPLVNSSSNSLPAAILVDGFDDGLHAGIDIEKHIGWLIASARRRLSQWFAHRNAQ